MGDPQAGAPVPDGKGGFQRDEAGKLITTLLAEKKLVQAAEATGGIYIRSTVTDTGLKTLERRIRALDLAEQSSAARTIPVEKFPLALIAAAAALFFYLIISERPRRKKMFILFVLALFCCGAAENPGGQNASSEVEVKETLPEDAESLYNLDRKRQIEGKENAVQLYEAVLKKADKKSSLRSRTFFNLGTGVHSGGRQSIAGAVSQVQCQQLDPALEKLKEAEKRLAGAEELYARSLSVLPAGDAYEQISGNLQILESDRQKIKDLKKKII